ncbi:probable inactive leucine-rich repeat receptor-like protein kinase At3g03770 [Ziziphus jujuba]|uniref:Probable inactive leucine-rich repeat receptor-like protein kinase At3g03770 n=1 Tax=Ziziphus jujuba TaxID=326968 RepID=A0A6P3YYF2_ZIZJJ|nr:probable inactive leucine-rich repeat receptor-like protein kinase At3g03770 [Ziziphus jujuba]
MAKPVSHSHLLLLVVSFLSFQISDQFQLSQSQTLLKIHQILNYPSALSSFSNPTDLCNIEPTSSLTLQCYEGSITQLHLIGNNEFPPLPQTFSIESFFSTLENLPSLKVLSLVSLGLWGPLPGNIGQLSSLEILNVSSNYFNGVIPVQLLHLRNLQTLILDHNNFTGELPVWLNSLPLLTVLSLKNNGFTGSLPSSLGTLHNLRVLSLSENNFSGEVPNLSHLTNLQVFDVEDNSFGHNFPDLPTKLITLILRKNRFRLGIPAKLGSYYQLQKLDISLNGFVGPFLPSLISLPSLSYLDIGGNKFTGRLSQNMSCSTELSFVNLSTNLLSGDLPSCLTMHSKKTAVWYARNCLSNDDQEQHPSSFCHNEALAVEIINRIPTQKKTYSTEVLSSSVAGGIVGVIVVVGLVSMHIRRTYGKNTEKKPSTRFITENASTVNTAKLLSDARYISETMKMGANLPAYRSFAFEELKEATNNFETSTFMGEGSRGEIYRGKLSDGTLIAVRVLKIRKRHSPQVYMHHIELISKLRHRHLVSALGHCLEYQADDSGISRIYIVFEFVPNGTLRGCISGPPGQKLTWTQRISAAIGVAKGIQFLHTGIVPGVYSNSLKITNVLMDHDLHVKLSSYNLPLLSETMGPGISHSAPKGNGQISVKHEDKSDVYDIGVVLLEIILGRPIMFQNEVGILKDLLRVSITTDDTARRSIVDPAVQKECLDKSLKTMMEICVRCLSNEQTDRPSVEDILWNLQYAAQVQDTGRVDSPDNQESPISSTREMQPPTSLITSNERAEF